MFLTASIVSSAFLASLTLAGLAALAPFAALAGLAALAELTLSAASEGTQQIEHDTHHDDHHANDHRENGHHNRIRHDIRKRTHCGRLHRPVDLLIPPHGGRERYK